MLEMVWNGFLTWFWKTVFFKFFDPVFWGQGPLGSKWLVPLYSQWVVSYSCSGSFHIKWTKIFKSRIVNLLDFNKRLIPSSRGFWMNTCKISGKNFHRFGKYGHYGTPLQNAKSWHQFLAFLVSYILQTTLVMGLILSKSAESTTISRGKHLFYLGILPKYFYSGPNVAKSSKLPIFMVFQDE